MKILLSNDDGIYAPGIQVMHRLLLELGHEVRVVAPRHECSGTSHSITLDNALTTEKVYLDGEFFGVAIKGFPADCVRLGVNKIYPDTELVVSGINLGLNAGPCVYYSGTVAAACEGYFASRCALAFSLNSYKQKAILKLSDKLRLFLPKLLKSCQEKMLYNINIPDTEEIKGVKITRQSQSNFKDLYEQRFAPRGNEYFWLRGLGFTEEMRPALRNGYPGDLEVLQQGYISLTPLQYDMTAHDHLQSLSDQFSQA